MNKVFDSVAILDCGGQYTKVIDRRLRELGVKTDIFSSNIEASVIQKYKGIVLSGGPKSVWAEDKIIYDKDIFSLNIPILGICYGMQLINAHFGGEVVPSLNGGEYGQSEISINNHDLLFSNLQNNELVLMSHVDYIKTLASDFVITAKSGAIIAAIANEKNNIYGVQFHPEVDLTINGKIILQNFLRNICKLECNYVLEDRIDKAIIYIKNKVQHNPILVLVSGGVDSAVSAALLCRALNPEQVYAIHVDHGFMRKNESEMVCRNLHELGLKHIIHVKAQDKFLYTKLDGFDNNLANVTDPEQKRHIIGNIFVQIITEEATKLGLDFDNTFWAQGTLRPDLIESGNPDISKNANKIKTHHNDVDLVRKARDKGLIIETNADWHKDEVRLVAKKLGLSAKIAERQPFPGPGLAIRMICVDQVESEPEQNLIMEMTLQSNFGAKILALKSVGVQGDYRSYRHLGVIFPKSKITNWQEPYLLAKTLTNKTKNINRVALLLSNHDNMNMIINTMFINKDNTDELREIDAIMQKYLNSYKLSQYFAVLLPISISSNNHYSIAFRAIITNDFMTGRPAEIGVEIPELVMYNLVAEIKNTFSNIDYIFYDVTSKPPATVEWE